MELLTVKEVWAEVLNKKVGLAQVYALVKNGTISSVRFGGKILIRKESIHAWILDQEKRKDVS